MPLCLWRNLPHHTYIRALPRAAYTPTTHHTRTHAHHTCNTQQRNPAVASWQCLCYTPFTATPRKGERRRGRAGAAYRTYRLSNLRHQATRENSFSRTSSAAASGGLWHGCGRRYWATRSAVRWRWALGGKVTQSHSIYLGVIISAACRFIERRQLSTPAYAYRTCAEEINNTKQFLGGRSAENGVGVSTGRGHTGKRHQLSRRKTRVRRRRVP